MSELIMEIQKHLDQYRKSVNVGVPFNPLSTSDVSALRGHVPRSTQDQEMDYKRGWAKLAKAQRLNRLMNYHQKLTQDYQLTIEQQNQLKTLFYEAIGSTLLNRDNICYNSNEGHITNIDSLKRDHDGMFFFDTRHEHKPSIISVGTGVTQPIQTVKKFTPVSVALLSTAQRKQKPVIKIKGAVDEEMDQTDKV